jgi:hypothetical protein
VVLRSLPAPDDLRRHTPPSGGLEPGRLLLDAIADRHAWEPNLWMLQNFKNHCSLRFSPPFFATQKSAGRFSPYSVPIRKAIRAVISQETQSDEAGARSAGARVVWFA